jgi:hypothetical protein
MFLFNAFQGIDDAITTKQFNQGESIGKSPYSFFDNIHSTDFFVSTFVAVASPPSGLAT